MSKITEAINRAQKEFTKALDEVTESQKKSDESPLYIKEPLGDLRSAYRYRRDPWNEKLAKAKPLIFFGVLLVLLFIFIFGVLQGKKINELQIQDGEKETVLEEAMVDQEEKILFTMDELGQTMVYADGQWLNYKEQRASTQTAEEVGLTAPLVSDEIETKDFPYTIQLVTYSNSDRAQEERVRLANLGFDAFVIPSGNLYQVAINHFEDLESATRFLRSLDQQFFNKYQGAYVRLIKRR